VSGLGQPQVVCKQYRGHEAEDGDVARRLEGSSQQHGINQELSGAVAVTTEQHREERGYGQADKRIKVSVVQIRCTPFEDRLVDFHPHDQKREGQHGEAVWIQRHHRHANGADQPQPHKPPPVEGARPGLARQQAHHGHPRIAVGPRHGRFDFRQLNE